MNHAQSRIAKLKAQISRIERKLEEIHNECKVIEQATPQMYHHHQDVDMGLAQQGNDATNKPNGTNYGVVLKKLTFFEVMGTLLAPTMLDVSDVPQMKRDTYYFRLTSQQADEISINRITETSRKPEYLVQVQLRFCALASAPSYKQQDDYLPPLAIINVNNKMCDLPKSNPPRPVNITPYVDISPMKKNKISVSWTCINDRNYVVAVYLVKKLSPAQLVNGMIAAQKIQPSNETREMIKGKLKEDADCEIAATTQTLVCPLGKMKMKTPCRATTCSHFQCFDAETYLQMNENKPTWNCPVCDKPALYEKLVIDAYFQEVLSSADADEIQLNKDGSWSAHVVKNDVQSLDTPPRKYQRVDNSDNKAKITDNLTRAILMAIQNDPIITNLCRVATLNESTMSKITITSRVPPVVTQVDLTQDDSDDEVPIKRRTAAEQIVSTSTTVNATATQRRSGLKRKK